MSQNIHGFAVVHNGARSLYATTNAGLHVSEDNGANWTMKPIASVSSGAAMMAAKTGPP